MRASFPHIYQMLANLPNVTSGWYDVPGIEGLTRFEGKPREHDAGGAQVPAQATSSERSPSSRTTSRRSRAPAGSATSRGCCSSLGVGADRVRLRPRTLVGAATRRAGSRGAPSSRPACWSLVARRRAAVLPALPSVPTRLITKLQPAFDAAARRRPARRDRPHRAGRALRRSDHDRRRRRRRPRCPSSSRSSPDRPGLSKRDVRSALQQRRPADHGAVRRDPADARSPARSRTFSRSSSRKLHVGGDSLVQSLRKRTPGLAQALLAVGPATAGWDAIPGSAGPRALRRLGTPVRSMPQFADYLDLDARPALRVAAGQLPRSSPTRGRRSTCSPASSSGSARCSRSTRTAMLFLATGAPKRY